MEIFIKNEGWGVNQIGEGLQYPVYGGKNSPVLRYRYEVMKRKNTKILEKGLQITSN